MSVVLEKEIEVNLQQVMALANRFILTKLPDNTCLRLETLQAT